MKQYEYAIEYRYEHKDIFRGWWEDWGEDDDYDL